MIELLHQEFIQRALIAGVGLAVPLGILGCFLLWRRMAFFSDAMGHAAILGVTLGIIFHLPVQFAIFGVALLSAFILSQHQSNSRLPFDTWLGAVSYGGLSLGLCLMAFYPSLQLNPEAILFGEILSVTWNDVVWIMVGAFMTPFACYKIWRSLILVTMDEDLAFTSNISVSCVQVVFLGIISLITSIGLKITGALLLPALMIFPAATSSYVARSPEGMVIISSLVAIITFLVGALLSFYMDLPTGPMIVVVSLMTMILVSLLKKN